jgi:ABC-type transport system involved in multi-copper enzyme maturation permease subunit
VRRLTTAEFFKLTHRRMTWILAAIVIVLTGVVYTVILIRVQNGGNADRPDQLANFTQFMSVTNVVPFGYSVTQQLVTILGIVLAGAAVGSEFGWRTVLLMTAWTGARVRLVAAKLLVLALLVAAGVLVGFFASLAGSVITGLVRGSLQGSAWSGSLLPHAIAGGARTWLAVLPYVLLAGALAMLGRSTTLGVAVGLAVLFLEHVVGPLVGLLGHPFDNLQNVFLYRNAGGLMQANGILPGSDSTAGVPSPVHGAVVLLIYAALFVGITFLAFLHRDLTE